MCFKKYIMVRVLDILLSGVYIYTYIWKSFIYYLMYIYASLLSFFWSRLSVLIYVLVFKLIGRP